MRYKLAISVAFSLATATPIAAAIIATTIQSAVSIATPSYGSNVLPIAPRNQAKTTVVSRYLPNTRITLDNVAFAHDWNIACRWRGGVYPR